MAEVPLDIPRIWVEFPDPDDAGQRFRCDLTWLTSSWMCIYGNGCQGIYADRPDDGCCTLGAHFTEDDDYERVAAVAAELGPDEWQYRDVAYRKGLLRKDFWTEEEDGATKTKVVDGACIFLNRPGFPGGMGCALHQHAVLQGLPPTSLKPEVCWQLPIRRSYRTIELADQTSYLEVTITEYDRRGWGPGGHDLDWYCSGNPDAHVGREPVYRSSKVELVELMGETAYEELVLRCEAHLRAVTAARRIGNRKLLPLLVHPATLAAQDVRSAERESAAKVEKHGEEALAPMTDGTVIPSPNIWESPDVYELENRGVDRAGVIETAMREVDDWAGKDLLDVGCGTGFHLPGFATTARSVVGVEPHPPLVVRARHRVAALPSVRVVRASAEATTLREASVDVAHARWAYFFGPGCEPGLAELDRVMRPGGTAFVVDNDATRSTFGTWFRRSLPRYDPEAVERFWARRGWSRERLDIEWTFDSPASFARVLGIELPATLADEIVAADPGRTGVDYAVNLWWRHF